MADYAALIRTAEEDVKKKACCSYGQGVVCFYYLNICADILTCPYKRRIREAIREEVKKEAETGWLVENGKAGTDLRYRTVGALGIPIWTDDANKAIRFARRADAEMFAAEDEDAWRIVEHCWADGKHLGERKQEKP